MELIDEIEEEIDKLKNNEYGLSVIKTKYRGIITTSIIIPNEIINKNISKMSIEFQLIIDTNSLKLIPKLYCVSPFCYPHFADGRDLFNELRSAKNPQKNNWLSNLLSDILEFIKINYEKGGLYFIGNYYLGTKYDLRLIQKGCDNILNVKENLVINGKNLKLNRILVLSDVYFLLFEQEKWYKNNLTLLFWSSISNIQKIQKVKETKTVILQWAQKEKGTYPMSLTLIQRESFIRDLLEKMHHFGMVYDVTRMDGSNFKKGIDIAQSQNIKLINDYNRQEQEKNKNNEEEEEEYEEGEEEEEDDVDEDNNKPNEQKNVKLDIKQKNEEENTNINNDQNQVRSKDENNHEEINKVQKENKIEEDQQNGDDDEFIEVENNEEINNKNIIKENLDDKSNEKKDEIKMEEKEEDRDEVNIKDKEEEKNEEEEKKENESKE